MAAAKMITITIDGTKLQVPDGIYVWDACRMIGIEIPNFCYLPGLRAFGACRMCVVEVSGLDRQGLLFDLTSQLSALNLNIVSAHIATFGERAVDVFYVTDLTGAKVTSAARQNAIRRRLLGAFKSE